MNPTRLRELPWRRVLVGVLAVSALAYPTVVGSASLSPDTPQRRTSEESSTVTVSRTARTITVRLGDSVSKEETLRQVTSTRSILSKE